MSKASLFILAYKEKLGRLYGLGVLFSFFFGQTKKDKDLEIKRFDLLTKNEKVISFVISGKKIQIPLFKGIGEGSKAKLKNLITVQTGIC